MKPTAHFITLAMRWIALLALALTLTAPLSVNAQSSAPQALVLTANGALTPAMAEYLSRGLQTAERMGVEVVIFQLNTPGGGVELMNRMVQDLLDSPVPVIVYVAPRGAMAGSAGTVLTLAGHAAAMAPETVIGAASPVGSEGEDLGQTMEAKVKNVLKATVRTLAERRGAQAIQLAEETIETAQAVSASEALEAGLVDFIASDVDDLLRQLDGFSVSLKGEQRTLSTAGAAQAPFNPSLIEQLLGILTNPNIVFILLNIGLLAILIELSSPGGWVAGFIGVVCLALAIYGLGVLEINYFGIIFLVTAFVLFLLDIKAPTHGALTAAAVGSLIVGALVLFNSPSVPNFQQRVSVPLIIGTSLIIGAMFFVVLLIALRAQSTPRKMGAETIPGQTGKVTSRIERAGIVQLGGERWTAVLAPGEEPLPVGALVEVVEVQGLRLVVRKIPAEKSES
ncbi:MAG: nodulation protein NfeD [Anaerolineales bacterium]|nr:nodulation protein NfeD [Anaerolineales bacterium]